MSKIGDMQHFVLFHFETLEDEGSIFLGNLNNRLSSDATAYPSGIRPHSHESLETRIMYYIFKSNGNYSLTLRRLMSYIYGAPIFDVSRSHTTTHHSR